MTPESLKEIASRTLGHYEQRADDFWEGTKDHDVSQNIGCLLGAIRAEAPFEILDFGCGPGRDLKTFTDMGHRATGLDGTLAFVTRARQATGCEVLHQNFFALDLPAARFDGVFANAVLFHVPAQILPGVLAQLRATLKAGGVLFCSNPRGQGQQEWKGERFGVFHDWDGWRAFMVKAGFDEITHYYRPEGLPRDEQPWLASAWRKPQGPA